MLVSLVLLWRTQETQSWVESSTKELWNNRRKHRTQNSQTCQSCTKTRELNPKSHALHLLQVPKCTMARLNTCHHRQAHLEHAMLSDTKDLERNKLRANPRFAESLRSSEKLFVRFLLKAVGEVDKIRSVTVGMLTNYPSEENISNKSTDANSGSNPRCFGCCDRSRF